MASATELETLVVKLVGDSANYEHFLERVEGKTEQKTRSLVKKFDKVGRKFTAIGRQMTLLTAPLLVFGGLAVREFAKFDDAMTKSTAIMVGLTDDLRARMEETAKSIARNSVTSAEDLAKSYYFLASAGMSAEESIGALAKVEKFAVAGAFDMARATDLLTDAQSALGLSSGNTQQKLQQLTRVGDVLVKANTLANASVEQFATSLTTKSGAALRLLNKDVEEGVAVLAAYADQGVKAELAGERLAIMLRDLQAASQKQPAIWEQFGLKVFDAQGSMRSIADIITDLEVRFGSMSNEQQRAAFSMLGFQDRSVNAVSSLLGTSDAIRQYESQLRSAGGITESVADAQLESFSSQMKILKNRAVGVAMEIGEMLLPTMRRLMSTVEQAINWWNSLDTSTRNWLVTIGQIAVVAGPTLIVFGKLFGFTAQIMQMTAALAAQAAQAGITAVALRTMKIAATGLAIGGIIYLARQVFIANDAIREFNKQLERASGLNDKLTKREVRQQQAIIKQASRLQGVAKEDFLNEQIKRASKEMQGLKFQVKNAQAQYDKLNTTYNAATGNKLLKGAGEDLKLVQRRAEMAEEFIHQLKEQLDDSIHTRVTAASEAARQRAIANAPDVTGVINAELKASSVDAEAQKATKMAMAEAQKAANSLEREVGGIFDQTRTPLEKYNAALARLNQLLQMGKLSQETYNRAVALQKERLKQLETQTNRTAEAERKLFGAGEVSALEFGSAAVEGRLAKLRLSNQQVVKPEPKAKFVQGEGQFKRRDKGDRNALRQTTLLEQIAQNGRQANQDKIVIKPANI